VDVASELIEEQRERARRARGIVAPSRQRARLRGRDRRAEGSRDVVVDLSLDRAGLVARGEPLVLVVVLRGEDGGGAEGGGRRRRTER
jgi:hypothetical protein